MRERKFETIKIKTINELKSLGIYRSEYGVLIEVYAQMIEQYQALKAKVDVNAYVARSPAVISLETLRKDILQYSAQLGLSPSGYRKITGDDMKKPKRSKLESALDALR